MNFAFDSSRRIAYEIGPCSLGGGVVASRLGEAGDSTVWKRSGPGFCGDMVALSLTGSRLAVGAGDQRSVTILNASTGATIAELRMDAAIVDIAFVGRAKKSSPATW
ncbi:MAG TPA: hypothetical protein VF785_20460 [Gemmatimonadaceae bacterium]